MMISYLLKTVLVLGAFFISLSALAKPQVVIFTAPSWCSTCIEMESTTFRDPLVIKALKNYRVTKVNVSFPTPAQKRLQQAERVLGVPTIIIKNSQGHETRRFVGFVSANILAGALEVYGDTNKFNGLVPGDNSKMDSRVKMIRQYYTHNKVYKSEKFKHCHHKVSKKVFNKGNKHVTAKYKAKKKSHIVKNKVTRYSPKVHKTQERNVDTVSNTSPSSPTKLVKAPEQCGFFCKTAQTYRSVDCFLDKILLRRRC